MFGGGRRMGAGGRGGGMLKTVGRSMTRAGVTNLQETKSSSSNTTTATGSAATTTSPTAVSRSTHKHHILNSHNNNNLMLSGSQFPACNSPVYGNQSSNNNNSHVNSITSWPCFSSGSSCDDQYEWVSVDASEEEKMIDDDFVFAPVPSAHEVHTALSALTQVFDAAPYPSRSVSDNYVDKDVDDQISTPTGVLRRVCPSVGLDEVDWMDPDSHPCNSRMLHPYGPGRVYDAFHLLQNEPSVQRMVVSLSSDKAVWDAVLNNEAVRELRETYSAEENDYWSSTDETGDDSNPALNAVKWIFDNTVSKFMEVFKKITMLMNGLFKPPDETGKMDPFEEKLRTSFLLSVVVLLVVVVTRAAHRA